MRAGGGWPRAKAARKGRGKARFPRLRRLGAVAAAPFAKVGRYAFDRLTEASSAAALGGGVLSLAAARSYGEPDLGYLCLALAFVQALLPDGTLSFERDPRRRRRRPSR